MSDQRSPIARMIDAALGVTPEKEAEWAENHKRNNAAYALVIEALLTDGAQHKQWYLAEIAKTLGGDLGVVREALRKEGYDWEDGVAP